MGLKELRLSDRDIFEEFFALNEYCLSTYHFCNIFIWKSLFRIFYTILNGCLCLFFKDKTGCFMYLPPLSVRSDSSVIEECFRIMDGFNNDREISRIENVEAKQLEFYQKLGYGCFAKSGDYLYRIRDIVYLKGNKFKSKRASYNYFIKHYDFGFRPFLKQDTDDCLALYQQWAGQRKNKFSDLLYQAMLGDSLLCQKMAMKHFPQLGLIGYVAKVKDRIAGYTLGFPINSKTFCILFEIYDLSYRGIPQFIFSQFCQQLSDYQYINVMDDSGLENLRREKLSYHPVRVVPNYIIKRQ